jgi:hypothetical protein
MVELIKWHLKLKKHLFFNLLLVYLSDVEVSFQRLELCLGNHCLYQLIEVVLSFLQYYTVFGKYRSQKLKLS